MGVLRDSMTQGPAMRKKLRSLNGRMKSMVSSMLTANR